MPVGTEQQTSSSQELSAFNSLGTDEKLGLLWVVYKHMGESITPAAPGAAAPQFTKTLLNEVKGMEHEAQLNFMRDLVNKSSTEQTKAYGAFDENNKLLFWYELSEEMTKGTVVPVPDDYELSADGSQVFDAIAALDYNEQITLLRDAVVDMGTQA